MVVAVQLDELYWFARRLHCRTEFTVLTLKLRRLEAAMSDDHRSDEPIEVAQRAQRLDQRCGEVDVTAAYRQADRIQVVHAARTQTAFHSVDRQPELLLPVRREDHCRKMGAR